MLTTDSFSVSPYKFMPFLPLLLGIEPRACIHIECTFYQ